MERAGKLLCLAVSAIVLAGVGAGLTPAAAADPPKCEPNKLGAKYPGLVGKTIKIGQDGQTPPFSFRDPKDVNHIIGFDADYARKVFECVGVPYEFVTGSWSGLMPAVAAGRIDVMWDGLYYTAERAKQVDFVIYTTVADAVLLQKGNPKNIKSLDDLCGKRVVAGLGTLEQAMLTAFSKNCTNAGKPEINMFTAQDKQSEWRLIENDRADAAVTNYSLADAVAADNPKAFERGFSFKSGIKVGAVVAKGNKELEQAIYEAIKALQANHEILKVYDDYQMDGGLVIDPEILTE